MAPPLQQVASKESGNVAQDSVIIKKVLKAVRTHVLTVTQDRRRPLVIKDGKKSRRFIVMNFLDSVSQNKGVYTAQVDADEFDHKIPRILYVDVKVSKGNYKVSRIRIGPNRFRDKGMYQ
jgi:hypothetical protein